MNEHDEYLRDRHCEPLSLRELLTSERGINWALIVVIAACAAVWAWIGYGLWSWLP